MWQDGGKYVNVLYDDESVAIITPDKQHVVLVSKDHLLPKDDTAKVYAPNFNRWKDKMKIL